MSKVSIGFNASINSERISALIDAFEFLEDIKTVLADNQGSDDG